MPQSLSRTEIDHDDECDPVSGLQAAERRNWKGQVNSHTPFELTIRFTFYGQPEALKVASCTFQWVCSVLRPFSELNESRETGEFSATRTRVWLPIGKAPVESPKWKETGLTACLSGRRLFIGHAALFKRFLFWFLWFLFFQRKPFSQSVQWKVSIGNLQNFLCLPLGRKVRLLESCFPKSFQRKIFSEKPKSETNFPFHQLIFEHLRNLFPLKCSCLFIAQFVCGEWSWIGAMCRFTHSTVTRVIPCGSPGDRLLFINQSTRLPL